MIIRLRALPIAFAILVFVLFLSLSLSLYVSHRIIAEEQKVIAADNLALGEANAQLSAGAQTLDALNEYFANGGGAAYLYCYHDTEHLWDRCRDGLRNANGHVVNVVNILRRRK